VRQTLQVFFGNVGSSRTLGCVQTRGPEGGRAVLAHPQALEKGLAVSGVHDHTSGAIGSLASKLLFPEFFARIVRASIGL
jgi:hypothetical protein